MYVYSIPTYIHARIHNMCMHVCLQLHSSHTRTYEITLDSVYSKRNPRNTYWEAGQNGNAAVVRRMTSSHLGVYGVPALLLAWWHLRSDKYSVHRRRVARCKKHQSKCKLFDLNCVTIANGITASHVVGSFPAWTHKISAPTRRIVYRFPTFFLSFS